MHVLVSLIWAGAKFQNTVMFYLVRTGLSNDLAAVRSSACVRPFRQKAVRVPPESGEAQAGEP